MLREKMIDHCVEEPDGKILADNEKSGEELYRLAADELERQDAHQETLGKIYSYEIRQLSDRPVHTAKERIHARLKANWKLSLLLLKDGYEDAAIDNILKIIQDTRRGVQIRMSALLKGSSQ